MPAPFTPPALTHSLPMNRVQEFSTALMQHFNLNGILLVADKKYNRVNSIQLFYSDEGTTRRDLHDVDPKASDALSTLVEEVGVNAARAHLHSKPVKGLSFFN